MPFKEDSPFEKSSVQKPLLPPPEEEGDDLESRERVEEKKEDEEGDDVDDKDDVHDDVVTSTSSSKDMPRAGPKPKHVHFTPSIERALVEKEWDEEHGIMRDEDGERILTWEEYWEWVKAEVKCYSNYICPILLVNACIIALVIVYFWTR